jgi:uncharacterized protein
MATGEDIWLTMDDGVRLAATLYLPDGCKPAASGGGSPVPCLLEALPYRKDDVTAGYASEYERLRDEHGYAVCRVDLRGTGSSEGVAVDEYPLREQDDLVAVIAWLAAQPWCTGNVGMFGTSYSGFNSIQVAMRRPPALKAIVPIYATDDRYTDDVHKMGGALRLLDLIDYPTYMVAMNALPPAPAVFGPGWREEWQRRLDAAAAAEPWLLGWLAEQTDGAYWRHGSLRPDYGAITAPTMIVAGWADGYRNNSFRTYAGLASAGTPTRLLVGPWSHMSAATSLPGPHLDLVSEMARWFDRWLRGADTGIGASGDPAGGEAPIVYFGRRSATTPPEPDAVVVTGEWRAEWAWPSPRLAAVPYALGGGLRPHPVRPDTGSAAWNSCAGNLPYGQPTDQRFDDAASLVWDLPVADELELLGHARLDLRVAADQPVASVSAKLCDVAPDGTSTLITRGLLNLTHRTGHTEPQPLTPGTPVNVEVELEATAYTVLPGHRLRLAVTGVDWPNTIAPPAPVTLTVDGDRSLLHLPLASGPPSAPVPAALRHLDPPTDPADHSGTTWRVTDDVLARVTGATVDHGSTYDITGPGSCTDRYTGTVTVDRRTWVQSASSTATFTIDWPEATVRAHAAVDFRAYADRFEIAVSVEAIESGSLVAAHAWKRSIGRHLA